MRENSLRKILRESSENLMSTARLNFNPTDAEACNTARTNLVSVFDNQYSERNTSR